MPKKLTKEGFIEKARGVHGDKYDYSKVEYVNNHTKVCIICPEHGEFWQIPNNHIHKNPKGCPKCGGSAKLTTEDFIRRSRKKHGNKYDYLKVKYINNNTKVCIICLEHGVFWQSPNSHLSGCGCPKCANNIVLTTEDFIRRANKIHNNKYNYTKVEYKGANTKVIIICPEHGEFLQTPSNHINRKHGCPKCAGKAKLTTEYFIEIAREVHGDKYNYSKVELVNNKTPVCINCPEHGDFWQTPDSHLHKHGCTKCAGNIKLTLEDFKQKAREIHGDKYDYSKVELVNNKIPVCIICPEHSEFKQSPSNHLRGQGCPECGNLKRSLSQRLCKDEFIERARKIHGDKYDYSKIELVNMKTPVCIICPEHGEFWQKPVNHLSGCSCPKCNSSKLEIKLTNFLLSNGFTESNDNNDISENTFIRQKKFDWLKHRGKLSLDFYLLDYNIAIECQGIQHFEPLDIFGGEKGFIKTQKRDSVKKKLCESHGIKILYYSDLGIEYPYKVYENLDELLNEIKSNEKQQNK